MILEPERLLRVLELANRARASGCGRSLREALRAAGARSAAGEAEEVLDAVLDRPSRRLVVYGTLAPGEPNEWVLAGLEGEWRECRVRGGVSIRRGLRYFRWDPEAGEVRCLLFVSGRLPGMWPRLDAFEGPGYRRILVPAELEGRVVAANIYEGRE
ncbi:hypothetical protein E0L93_03085 [Rubrobacter taiwanensis]|jgi:gamma-glutamylcyclotransferase (GGCT)/AIG2-like uncharacterized protein YtfP|uniref:Gamma-glutamylcyclotransferase AIG2-like domain-containing protein n=1 Tax=Rubrobacter taiwanensis TaxID=185139 RepID=A0A4R1BQU1_9ACTN|nr:gamma-glutamylcyclotransferase [Rubrobacter taiwanensis]TCJ19948.1 hypothetical protein E0L93_03085 [Rubrobacter taiwanensis]